MATGKPVFLSYASQDAEVARRLAEALRAAGVEAWFDQSELKGGDVWDQKIRRRIKECVLFVPLISATTQARPEGYFRLEWRLAVERSHLLADDHPFLFPVVIDDTAEPEARVPDRFRDFQWSRLGRSQDPDALAERVARLLSGEVVPPAGTPDESVREKPRRRRERRPAWFSYTMRIGGLVIAIGYMTRPLWSPRQDAPPTAAAPKTAATLSEAAQLAARAIAIYSNPGYTREELAAAEGFALKATQLEPGSAAAWGALAGVHSTYVQRGWDRSQKRQQDTQTAANNALARDANASEAMFARGQLLLRGGRLLAEAESLFRRALELEPANNRYRRALADTVGALGRREEQRVLYEDAVKQDPADPIVRYDFANWFISADRRDSNPVSPENVAAALQQIEAGLTIKKLNSLLILRARLLAGNGDLSGMRSALNELEKLPLADREEDRAVNVAMWGALLERDLAKALAAAALTSKTYFDDGALSVRSKEALLALADQQGGRPARAQLVWKQAETTLRAKLRDDPTNTTLLGDLANVLAWQGQTEEAGRIFAPIEAATREAGTLPLSGAAARYYAALGDAARAVPYLRGILNRTPTTTPAALRLDPWWDKLRGQPEFDTFLAEATAAYGANSLSGPAQKAPP
jgi:tetratricopeptide (TPR) repeat protein